MFVLFGISVVYSIRYLNNPKEEYDLVAVESVNTGIIFYILGLLSGMLWANFTWGEFWSNDPKQNSAAIAFLLYCAYLLLRNSVDEEQKRSRISAIYNIFAFPIMFVLLIILPRLNAVALLVGGRLCKHRGRWNNQQESRNHNVSKCHVVPFYKAMSLRSALLSRSARTSS